MKYIQITLIALITLTIVSCSKKEVEPTPTEKFIKENFLFLHNGKYIAKCLDKWDNQYWFSVENLKEEDKMAEPYRSYPINDDGVKSIALKRLSGTAFGLKDGEVRIINTYTFRDTKDDKDMINKHFAIQIDSKNYSIRFSDPNEAYCCQNYIYEMVLWPLNGKCGIFYKQ